MEAIPNILLAALAIVSAVGLIVAVVIWLDSRAMQRKAAEMAVEAGETDQQTKRPIWRPGNDK